jgi:hypothetical protein
MLRGVRGRLWAVAVAALQAELEAVKRDVAGLPQLRADNERLRAAITGRDADMAAATAEAARLRTELAAKDGRAPFCSRRDLAAVCVNTDHHAWYGSGGGAADRRGRPGQGSAGSRRRQVRPVPPTARPMHGPSRSPPVLPLQARSAASQAEPAGSGHGDVIGSVGADQPGDSRFPRGGGYGRCSGAGPGAQQVGAGVAV